MHAHRISQGTACAGYKLVVDEYMIDDGSIGEREDMEVA